MKSNDKVHGEGNYEAARRYRRHVAEHLRKGDVEQEARQAKPGSDEEARELERAERAGRKHAKEEDPQLRPRRGEESGS